MQGHWANAAPYYRCRFPSEYALANRVEHPLNVTLRQDVLLEPLDGWLAAKFGPRYLPATIDELAAAPPAWLPPGGPAAATGPIPPSPRTRPKAPQAPQAASSSEDRQPAPPAAPRRAARQLSSWLTGTTGPRAGPATPAYPPAAPAACGNPPPSPPASKRRPEDRRH